jgi:thiol-disulfide isomerase/thioredoxin
MDMTADNKRKWGARTIWLVVVIVTVLYGIFKLIPPLLAAGTRAPGFTLKDNEGKFVRLSNFRGRVVVLDFWSTWCPACQQMMPDFGAAADSFKGQPVTFIGVNT